MQKYAGSPGGPPPPGCPCVWLRELSLGCVRSLLPLVLLGLMGQTLPPQADSARAVVREALHAVESGSVPLAEARWRSVLRRNPADRAALLGLASLARYTYRARAGDSLVAMLRQHPKTLDGYGMRAALGTGVAWWERSRYDSAAAWLAVAATEAMALHDSAAAVVALLEGARSEYGLRHQVLADSLRVLAVRFVPRNDRETEAYVRCARAWKGLEPHAARAPQTADSAAAFAESVGLRRVATWCRAIAAEGRSWAGDYHAIFDEYRAIAATADSLHDLFRASDVRGLRGAALISYGAMSEAMTDLERSMADARTIGDQRGEGWAAANMAQAYYALGDPALARPYAIRAISQLTTSSAGQEIGMAHSLRGDIAVGQGDYRGARAWYDSAARVFAAAGFDGGVAHAAELQAHVAMRLGAWGDAERQLLLAWRAAGANQAYSRPLTDYLLGTVSLHQGHLAKASRYYDRAAPGAVEEGNLRYYLGARRAEVALRRGDTALAERILSDATGSLEAWRATLSGQELRANAFQASPDEADPDMSVATILAALVRRGRTEAAFALAERRRARELLDHILRGKGVAGADTTDPSPKRSAAAPSVRRALGDSVALLEYVTGDGGEPTTLFVLSRDTVWGLAIAAVDSLAPLIGPFRAVLESNGNPRTLGAQLGSALLASAIRALPERISYLIVVPDGALHRLPFDALLMPDGRYLFERFAVSVAPSATVAMELLTRAPRVDPVRILAFGDPWYGPENTTSVDNAPDGSADSSRTRAGLQRLPASSDEVQLVARYAPGSRVLQQSAASEAQLKREPLGRYQIIHFATHALVDETSPTRTSLALTPGDGDDGFVRPGELSSLTLAANLVVLSACRTATGRLVRGEGMLGLTAPLLAAGARSVLATQWPIGDRATVPFVTRFYDGLARGLSVAGALRAARINAMRAGAPSAEWAAFALIGDPTVQVHLPESSQKDTGPANRWLGAGLFAAILGLAFLWWWRQKPGRIEQGRNRDPS